MADLIDTHCHIHDESYDFLIDQVLDQARQHRIVKLICVGTDLTSSKQALDLSFKEDSCHASLALHPHQANQPLSDLKGQFAILADLANRYGRNGKLVAIGECGLDYFYHKDKKIRDRQKAVFAWHLDLARDLNLPVIFHVRQAFDDFYEIYDRYQLKGVLHSFSDTADKVDRGLEYEDLYFGLNGIVTFSKDEGQLQAAKAIPDRRLVLETDAPYLAPPPFRGKINKPHYLQNINQFIAGLRETPPEELARLTTANAYQLFKF